MPARRSGRTLVVNLTAAGLGATVAGLAVTAALFFTAITSQATTPHASGPCTTNGSTPAPGCPTKTPTADPGTQPSGGVLPATAGPPATASTPAPTPSPSTSAAPTPPPSTSPAP